MHWRHTVDLVNYNNCTPDVLYTLLRVKTNKFFCLICWKSNEFGGSTQIKFPLRKYRTGYWTLFSPFLRNYLLSIPATYTRWRFTIAFYLCSQVYNFSRMICISLDKIVIFLFDKNSRYSIASDIFINHFWNKESLEMHFTVNSVDPFSLLKAYYLYTNLSLTYRKMKYATIEKSINM